jgi:hypothetical protein
MILEQVNELEIRIKIIEASPASYIGGSKSYFSGSQTHLKPDAQKKVDALNKKIEKLLDLVDEH